MKSTTLALASLLASAAVAQPHRQNRHQHPAKHVKKDVVWVTDWVSVTETVGITTTIWVDEGFVPSTSAAASQPSSSPKAASVAPSSSAPPVPAQFFEPASKQSSPSVYVAPSPSPPPYVAPVQSVQPVSVPEIKSSAPPAPVYVAPTTTAPVYTAPAYTAPTSAAAPASSAPAGTGSGSTGGACSSGSPCTGDFTYYDAGLGACGITNDGTTDKVVALSKLMMGAQSNSGDGANANPFCGKTITVKYKGKTTTAKVVDKCGDCSHDSIDLSKAAYADLADEGLGRDKAEWYFN